MAIADDFTVAVNGDIRHSANTNHYTVLELHRFLQDIADDETPATADDYVDITSATPSERSTDNIVTLINSYNIDDDASEYFYAGSITQDDGDTVYSGLKVLGAVNDSDTQLMVIQDNDYYQFTTTPDSPFWGTQATGGYNGDAAGGVLMRTLIKTRQYGADIDGKKIRVQARAWGDSYDFFNATLGQGEGVAAIGTTPDAQNTTAIATVQGWSAGDIPTNVEGFQGIDINNGNGSFNYYSKWTYNTNALAMKAVWEHIKEITGNDSPEAATPHSMNGELFLGVTHSWAYDGDSGRALLVVVALELVGHHIECPLPAHRLELALLVELTLRIHPQQRFGQAVGAVHDLRVEVTLDAVQTAVDRRGRVSLHGDDLVVLGGEHDAAAGPAKAADRFVPAPAMFGLRSDGRGRARHLHTDGHRGTDGRRLLDEFSPGQWHRDPSCLSRTGVPKVATDPGGTIARAIRAGARG